MVIPDLSAPQSNASTSTKKIVPIAPVADRILALVLDFLILSPVISLVIAGLMRQMKTFFLIDANSQEGVVAIALVIAAVFFLTILLQTVFLFFWQATPGQLFVQMRVISFPHGQERLSLNQCLLRSTLWCGGFVALAIPYLEILSHPLRRAFHERASDTMVVTLKREFDEGPYPLESRFIASWMRMSFLFLILFGVLTFFKTYHSLQAGLYKDKEPSDVVVCKETKSLQVSRDSRVDAAIALFLMDEISAECLQKEAETVLWQNPGESAEWAYLAKYLLTNGKEQEAYLEQICATEDSLGCVLARHLDEDSKDVALNLVPSLESQKSWTAQFLVSEEKFLQREYEESLKLIFELRKEPLFKQGLEKKYVRAIWALNEKQKEIFEAGRVPASAGNVDSWIEEFKDAYEVP